MYFFLPWHTFLDSQPDSNLSAWSHLCFAFHRHCGSARAAWIWPFCARSRYCMGCKFSSKAVLLISFNFTQRVRTVGRWACWLAFSSVCQVPCRNHAWRARSRRHVNPICAPLGFIHSATWESGAPDFKFQLYCARRRCRVCPIHSNGAEQLLGTHASC
jgi:hypothetical protein